MRSCRRSRNVKNTDSTSDSGAPRSKRRGKCSRGPALAFDSGISPPHGGSAAPPSPIRRAPRSAASTSRSGASHTPGLATKTRDRPPLRLSRRALRLGGGTAPTDGAPLTPAGAAHPPLDRLRRDPEDAWRAAGSAPTPPAAPSAAADRAGSHALPGCPASSTSTDPFPPPVLSPSSSASPSSTSSPTACVRQNQGGR